MPSGTAVSLAAGLAKQYFAQSQLGQHVSMVWALWVLFIQLCEKVKEGESGHRCAV